MEREKVYQAKRVTNIASVQIRNAAFEAVSTPEQNFSTPLLKVEHSILKTVPIKSEHFKSKQKLQWNLVLVMIFSNQKGALQIV